MPNLFQHSFFAILFFEIPNIRNGATGAVPTEVYQHKFARIINRVYVYYNSPLGCIAFC